MVNKINRLITHQKNLYFHPEKSLRDQPVHNEIEDEVFDLQLAIKQLKTYT